MTASISHKQPATKENTCAIQAHDLRKRYKGSASDAVQGLQLEISKGELFGLIGPDGAGKTTVLKMLSGVMEPSAGSLLVLGQRPSDARSRIGYVPQNCALYSDLTVDENLRYEAGLRDVPEDVFRTQRELYLKQMGLLKFADRLAGKLSGGMKQKLALCCALISQPALLLLDEPTTGLDPISRRELWHALMVVAQQGVTSIVATPFLDEAEKCTRIALLYEGTIHESGTPQELQAALGLKKLEIAVSSDGTVGSALTNLVTKRSDNIADLYTFGDHIEVLTQDVNAAEDEVRKLLSAEHISVETVTETTPTLENVFVMRLRELGLTESEAPPFPRLNQPKQERAAGHEQVKQKQEQSAGHQQPETAIHAQDLNKRFDQFEAVSTVSLDVHYGEIFGLLGANGAGKTTVIKMLCGLLQPTSGQVTLAGETGNLRSRKVRKKLGYMSQKFTLYDGLTVKENLEFYASIYEIPRKNRKEKVDWAMAACNLGELKDRLVGRLPLGWKQRIAFGASVMHEPEILFLDEPTAGVDPIARRQLWSLIRDFARSGTAVLVTTHYLAEAEYCNQLAMMADSQVLVQGSPNEIKRDHKGGLIEISGERAREAYQALGERLEPWRLTLANGKLRVLLDDPESDLPSLKSMLDQAGIRIGTTQSVPFSLEDAFIALVQSNRKERS